MLEQNIWFAALKPPTIDLRFFYYYFFFFIGSNKRKNENKKAIFIHRKREWKEIEREAGTQWTFLYNNYYYPTMAFSVQISMCYCIFSPRYSSLLYVSRSFCVYTFIRFFFIWHRHCTEMKEQRRRRRIRKM